MNKPIRLTIIIVLIIVLLIGISLQTIIAAADIKTTLINANTVSLQIGLLPDGANLPSVLTEEEKTACLAEFTTAVHQYYASTAGSNVITAKESMLNSAETTVDQTIAEGTFDTKTNFIWVWGDNATAEMTLTSWEKRIQEKGGAFHIFIPVSQARIKADMVKEGGTWKVRSYEEFQNDMGPQSYDSYQDSFATYEEAYAAALKMEVQNPF